MLLLRLPAFVILVHFSIAPPPPPHPRTSFTPAHDVQQVLRHQTVLYLKLPRWPVVAGQLVELTFFFPRHLGMRVQRKITQQKFHHCSIALHKNNFCPTARQFWVHILLKLSFGLTSAMPTSKLQTDFSANIHRNVRCFCIALL